MMGGGAFILLKSGHLWPETAKQTEIRLAILLKMLHTAHFGTAGRTSTSDGCGYLLFPLDMANHSELSPLLPSS
jgi:hypothetical protein